MLEPVQSATLTAVSALSHGFFTRAGGVSRGLYGSLNCGIGSSDDRAAVLQNRSRVADFLGTAPERLLTCHQVHSPTALVVEHPWQLENQPRADAMVTRARGLALGALAADCMPVLFADPVARVIGAAHAGWKGALGGILEATIATMEQTGARRSDIIAVVGPCISQAAYEVGPDFEQAFLKVNPSYSQYFSRKSPEARPCFNLPSFAVGKLRAAGLGSVDDLGQCTYAQPDRFYSYRRTTHAREPDYGRQISAIMLT